MEKIIEFIKDVNNNQFLILLFSGGIIWTLLSNIRLILSSLRDGVLACISFTINSVNAVDYDQQIVSFKMLKVMSNSKVLWERNIELKPTTCEYNETHLMNSAFGRSYRWLWGHLVILDRYYSTQSTKLVVTMTARVFFARKNKFLKRLLSEIEKCSLNDGSETILVNMGDGIVTEKTKRTIDSVYSNDNAGQRLLSDVKAFMSNRETYEKNNTPYKFVGLLAGSPGSGKTSTIHAIASELGMGIRFVNVDKEDFETIARVMCNNGSPDAYGNKSIIVIEDIDCMSMNADDKRKLSSGDNDKPFISGRARIFDDDSAEEIKMKEEYNRSLPLQDFKMTTLSLSSILNLLDGIITPSGIIVFLTTNNPDKLDSALLRDGRVDGRYDFGNFNCATSNKMIEDHLGFIIPDVKDGICPSSLQRDILKVLIGRMTKSELYEKYSRSGSYGMPLEIQQGK